MADQREEPADAARDGQPRLAAPVRRRGWSRASTTSASTGDVPSHPELLDHLAARFVRDGWSVKKLVRAVVLSRAYQLGSDGAGANLAVDPANRLVWRHAPRRLDAEEIRDAMLAAAGKLDPARPEGSPARDLKVMELPNNGPLARRLAGQARGQPAPQRLPAAAPRPDADLAGSLRLRRAGHGHRQPRHDHGRHRRPSTC